MNFLTTNCCIQNRINYGLNNLFGILNTLNLNIKEIKFKYKRNKYIFKRNVFLSIIKLYK